MMSHWGVCIGSHAPVQANFQSRLQAVRLQQIRCFQGVSFACDGCHSHSGEGLCQSDKSTSKDSADNVQLKIHCHTLHNRKAAALLWLGCQPAASQQLRKEAATVLPG